MSQGELNCLALSLFLPRARMAESPFRFIVIDDPVQAMDPVKVEGLARVLGNVAKDRQVVVLTHDDRLPQAVRRLDMEATIIELVRREQSVVELRAAFDPVRRHIEDALAVAQSKNLPRRPTVSSLDSVALHWKPPPGRLSPAASPTRASRTRRSRQRWSVRPPFSCGWP